MGDRCTLRLPNDRLGPTEEHGCYEDNMSPSITAVKTRELRWDEEENSWVLMPNENLRRMEVTEQKNS